MGDIPTDVYHQSNTTDDHEEPMSYKRKTHPDQKEENSLKIVPAFKKSSKKLHFRTAAFQRQTQLVM